MSVKLLHQNYHYGGRDEVITSTDPRNTKYHILFIPPLFAEMNKMRRTLVSVMRLLANKNIACSLPDLPGCNESVSPLNIQNLSSWREAMSACAEQQNIPHIAAFRGGCLIDNCIAGKPHYRLNPVKGGNIIKTMLYLALVYYFIGNIASIQRSI